MPSAQSQLSPPTVEVVNDAAALRSLCASWEALGEPSAPGAVFHSAAWLCPWWNTFSVAARGRWELRVLTARRAGELIGALPCYRERRLGSRSLRLLGDNLVGSDYLGVIAAPEDAITVADAFAGRILEEETDIDFGGMARSEPIAEALVRASDARGLPREMSDPMPCPYLDVRGAIGGFEPWLRTLPGGAGAQLLRRRRWLERCDGYRLCVAVTEAEVAGALEDLFRVHAARWEKEGGSEGIAGETVKRFHRRAAAELARRGEARIYSLSVEGAVVAALYGFERGGRFAFYQSGCDPAWQRRSVGTVVLGAAIEDSFRRGLAEFDFLRGDEAYKMNFASGRREIVRLRIRSEGSLRGLVDQAERGLRRVARALLPASAADALRRLRRVRRQREGT